MHNSSKQPAVYVVSNPARTVLYVGVTSNLVSRTSQHKQKTIDGFSKRYNCTDLLYFEQHVDMNTAIAREKQLKNWHRDWKFNQIRSQNPELRDLYDTIV